MRSACKGWCLCRAHRLSKKMSCCTPPSASTTQSCLPASERCTYLLTHCVPCCDMSPETPPINKTCGHDASITAPCRGVDHSISLAAKGQCSGDQSSQQHLIYMTHIPVWWSGLRFKAIRILRLTSIGSFLTRGSLGHTDDSPAASPHGFAPIRVPTCGVLSNRDKVIEIEINNNDNK